ncbi:MAG: DUF1178 family protein [Pseudomonadota bacterium]
MIRYALICNACCTEFDAWFASFDAFEEQRTAKQVACPSCAGSDVEKQIMAPAIAKTRRDSKASDFDKLAAAARDFIGKTHDYVGPAFAHEARAMHYGEIEQRPIWGETTAEEAESLKDEGVEAGALPAPFVPPKPVDPGNLN